MESNQDLKETQETNQVEAQEEQKPLFSGIDSQGKERLFTNAEEAQQSWQSAQNFIKDTVSEKKSLEARIQELEASLNQSKKLEDALAELNQSKEETQVNEPNQQQTTETTPQVDVEQLKQQIRDEVLGSLTQAQQQEVFSKNQAESIEAAMAVYGDSYEEKLRQRAKELDMTDEDIIREAQSSPKRFKELFGLNKQTNKQYVPNGSVTGNPKLSNKPALTGGNGFTTKQRLASHTADLEAIAKAKGYNNIKFY